MASPRYYFASVAVAAVLSLASASTTDSIPFDTGLAKSTTSMVATPRSGFVTEIRTSWSTVITGNNSVSATTSCTAEFITGEDWPCEATPTPCEFITGEDYPSSCMATGTSSLFITGGPNPEPTHDPCEFHTGEDWPSSCQPTDTSSHFITRGPNPEPTHDPCEFHTGEDWPSSCQPTDTSSHFITGGPNPDPTTTSCTAEFITGEDWPCEPTPTPCEFITGEDWPSSCMATATSSSIITITSGNWSHPPATSLWRSGDWNPSHCDTVSGEEDCETRTISSYSTTSSNWIEPSTTNSWRTGEPMPTSGFVTVRAVAPAKPTATSDEDQLISDSLPDGLISKLWSTKETEIDDRTLADIEQSLTNLDEDARAEVLEALNDAQSTKSTASLTRRDLPDWLQNCLTAADPTYDHVPHARCMASVPPLSLFRFDHPFQIWLPGNFYAKECNYAKYILEELQAKTPRVSDFKAENHEMCEITIEWPSKDNDWLPATKKQVCRPDGTRMFFNMPLIGLLGNGTRATIEAVKAVTGYDVTGCTEVPWVKGQWMDTKTFGEFPYTPPVNITG